MSERQKAARLTYKFDLPGGETRLREMVLYVCERCSSAERFGKVKLNKILWRADFTAFAERGIPVTGRSYIKLAAGPAPAEMPSLLAEMRADELIDFKVDELSNGYVEERPIATAKPNLRFFSPDDISFVETSIAYYWSKTATASSELSHTMAWKSRDFLDPMPYESIFLSDLKISSQDRARFAHLAKSMSLTTL